MSLRTRIGLLTAAAVAVAVVAASLALYLGTARTLRGSVDRSLRDLAQEARATLGQRLRPGDHGMMGPGVRPGRLGGAGGFVQIVDDRGNILGGAGDSALRLPVGQRTTAVANGAPAFYETVAVSDVPLRVLTVPAGPRLAVQIARPLDEVVSALASLRIWLALVSLGGIGLAAGLGTVVAGRTAAPVRRLTASAEHVAATQDLRHSVAVEGDDEIARLATAFNTMLENLEQSRQAQQQLVADASHELRTPLTSLRTNIEVLTDVDRLDESERRALISDVVVQLDEFSRLVGALAELTRGAQPAKAVAPVRLDDLVAGVLARVRTFAPNGQQLRLDAEPTTVLGESDRLERAVSNLVDNAVKYGGGAPIEVRVFDGKVEVHDHGPGIAPADLPHVFDRFYRAPEARSAPGSGLGLAIVRQVAESHGGTVTAEPAAGGGTVFRLSLPEVATDAPRADAPPDAALSRTHGGGGDT